LIFTGGLDTEELAITNSTFHERLGFRLPVIKIPVTTYCNGQWWQRKNGWWCYFLKLNWGMPFDRKMDLQPSYKGQFVSFSCLLEIYMVITGTLIFGLFVDYYLDWNVSVPCRRHHGYKVRFCCHLWYVFYFESFRLPFHKASDVHRKSWTFCKFSMLDIKLQSCFPKQWV